ncbi:hypothetical protein [Methylobacterium persicinum]|uniref:Uncharacterized protein n=1 Tax=Methylobacterium persicinum TaxID=374426 RepID=A0ABU0HQF8_9HYPH|nr:hypothetical protein [Methylobacterium persicinum]MDQ0444540.1 hypothetical protein [Methylobacterium persicinum]GJE40436.1 hypothetical protein KHHGKMAE_4529 [Methylobacterium persicinum]
MGLSHVVPLTEAAAFTAGCAMLRVRWLDAERVGMTLAVIAAVLSALLLVLLTSEWIALDSQALDPSCVWPQPE